MNWSSVFCMFGMALTRPSLTMQMTSGENVFARACVRGKGGHFKQLLWKYSVIWQETFVFVFVKCDTIFSVFFRNCHKFELLTFAGYSHRTAATYWRYGVKYYMGFVGSLLCFPAVKELWKSVTNWQRYRHEFDVLLFWDTVYMFSGSNTDMYDYHTEWERSDADE